MNLVVLIIALIILLIALWISVMLLWWHTEQGHESRMVNRNEVVRQANKVTRLVRRSWYGTMRYSKQVMLWGNKKTRTAFIAIFPKSKNAFTDIDPLTGLEHGPSSYFLASLSKSPKKKARIKKAIAPELGDLSE